jgi:hypothetical protein
MNIVEMIQGQVSGSMLNQLSSYLGMSEQTVLPAVQAAVPSLLSSISGLSSTEGGMRQVCQTLERFTPGAPDSLSGLLEEGPGAVAQQGGSLMSSLLGSDGVSRITRALSGVAGLGGGATQKLLGFLTPMVLGGIARAFGGRTITPEAVGSFFSQQKSSIAQSLGSLGGRFAPLAEAVAAPARQALGTTPPSPYRRTWVMPALVGVLLAIGVAFFISRQRHESSGTPVDTTTSPVGMPDFSRLSSDLASTTGDLKEALSSVKDSASAEAALPKIQELGGRIEDLKAASLRLPAEFRSKFDDLLQPQITAIEEQFHRVASMPGGDKIKPVLDDLFGRLKAPTTEVR